MLIHIKVRKRASAAVAALVVVLAVMSMSSVVAPIGLQLGF